MGVAVLKMSVRWLKNEPPHELEFEGLSDEVLRTRTGASSTQGVPKRFHSPKDLVALGIAGCTGVDVVSILKKMRQPLVDLIIETELSQTEDHPRLFRHCTLTYKFVGPALEQDRVLRAAALSFGKYCGVSAMIKRSGCTFEPKLELNGEDLTREFEDALHLIDDESQSISNSGQPRELKAAVLITGNELLLGKTSDTNGHFIIKQLTSIGLKVSELRLIGDDKEKLIREIRTLADQNDFIFMTGGLGPTKDDLTSEVVANAFNLPQEFSEAAWNVCLSAFQKLGRDEIPESNRKQAILPEGATVLENSYGTAAGFFVQHTSAKKTCHVFALPGVPWECEEMFTRQVVDKLPHQQRSSEEWGPWHVWGVGESALQTQLSAVEQELSSKDPSIQFSYQAHAGYISYGFKSKAASGNEPDEASRLDVLPEINRVEEIIGQRLLYKGNQSLLLRLYEGFSSSHVSLALAESCTGGRIAAELSAVAGISEIFSGGIVAYSNESKRALLKVSDTTLSKYGAVSSETAREMAIGARLAFNSSIALGVTGIAGPTGGSKEKPIGTVCFAISVARGLLTNVAVENMTQIFALQGWQVNLDSSEHLLFSVEKKFGTFLSRNLIQKRSTVYAQCALVMMAELLRGPR